MYRVDIYRNSKGNLKPIKNVAKNIPTWNEANALCKKKNKDLGLDPNNPMPAPGQKFAMFDNQ